ncbi:MAG: bifunctional heptose 7-phosphate kinase/heptose 1-phosphate adenyltransferase [Planctomycetota bacterium]|nr:bifunctional heptose 7-phosphate kinase/heptose 1-phosphate adenyltransferase [Planctomycetota bacterium]
MQRNLIEILETLGSPRVSVVGDFMLDRYVWGKVERVSPEAPVQILSVRTEDIRPGGAANVALNAKTLGARVTCLGVVGADTAGNQLVALLRSSKVNVARVIRDKSRSTPVKTRLLAQNQQMLRIDTERVVPCSPAVAARILAAARAELAKPGVLLLSDYVKGGMPPELLRGLISCARKARRPVLVDPKGRDFTRYRGATAITPNLRETETATGITLTRNDLAALRKAARLLVRDLDLGFIVIKRGEEGISLFERAGAADRNTKRTSSRRSQTLQNLVETHVPAKARAVFDVTGAGDTVLAALGAAIAAGCTPANAVRIANLAAGIVVGKVGTATTTREEMRYELAEEHRTEQGKLLPLPLLAAVLDRHRMRNEKIVFTNGCFDVLHAGHVRSFRFAKSKGDVLVVGVNSDASIRRIKGPGRPVNPEELRVQVLSALEDVDYVVVFGEPTPLKTIATLKPDVLVKGADWRDKKVVGEELVRRRGGRVEFAPLLRCVSTTSVLRKLCGDRCGDA